MTQNMTNDEYISAWEINAKQHFDDGDYNWICDQIRKIPFQKPVSRILEVGCGAGYSTLAFIQNNFGLTSVDVNTSAIDATRKLIREYDYSNENNTVKQIQADVVNDFGRVRDEIEIHPVDVIVICNPGGDTSDHLTRQEKKWLSWANFIEEEFTFDNLPRLHMYAMVYATCGLAIMTNRPAVIVMRDTYQELGKTLRQIGIDAGLKLVNTCLRQIKAPPLGGVPLSTLPDEDIWWGMGLYQSNDSITPSMS